jgi:hypothetical protein
MTHKTAQNEKEAWDVQETYDGVPHGWIQWKGTDVCMDVYCHCGANFHVDGDFAYNVKCPFCGRAYSCNGHIELIELNEEPERRILTDR